MGVFAQNLYKLVQAEYEQLNPSDILVEIGESAFSTTDLTVEVDTRLTELVSYYIQEIDPTFGGSAADHCFSDGVISSGAVTISRSASGTSGLKFKFIFVGRKIPAVT